MKKDNQMARIEQFIGQLQTPESKDAVILLDSEMDSAGAANVSPLEPTGYAATKKIQRVHRMLLYAQT